MKYEQTTTRTSLSSAQVIWWWELRRLAYNGALLIIGILSIAGMELVMSSALPTGTDAIEPMILMILVLLYGIMANLVYTLGWIVELATRKYGRTLARQRARRMFQAGFVFSCVLTTLPFWFGCAWRIAHAVLI